MSRLEQIAGQVFESGVDGDSGHGVPGADLARQLQRGDDVEAGRDAAEDPFLARQASGHDARLRLADGANFVVDLVAEMRRPKPGADPFHAVRASLPSR